MEVAGTTMTSSLADGDLYMDLLLAQLQHQSPDDPVSNSEMVTQMSQLATLDGINRLNASFSAVLELQRLLGGAELVGREVEDLYGGLTQTGTVESIATDGDTVSFMIDSYEITPESIRRIF